MDTMMGPTFIGCYVMYYYICLTRIVYFRQCLAFVFADVLQKELDGFLEHWNSHPIRPSRNTESPGGFPDDLYDVPELFGMLLLLCIKHTAAINFMYSCIIIKVQ